MAHIPPPAEELRIVDHELQQLESRRAVLLARRAWLVHVLGGAARPAGHGPVTPPGPAAGAQVWPPGQAATVPTVPASTAANPPTAAYTHPGLFPPPAVPPTVLAPPPAFAPGGRAGRPDASPPKVQNVLLVLGGVLLVIAAIAFTVVSWGRLGIVGRSVVLGAVTAAALGAAAPLLGRGLRSTAEAVAGLGLALTVLDAYALHEAAFADVDGVGWTAGAAAVLAAGWAGYGSGFRVLRLPPAAAVAAAQLPLLCWADAAGAGVRTVTAVLLVTAGGDVALALRRGMPPSPRRERERLVRLVAAVAACAAGGCALVLAAWLSWQAAEPYDALRAGALLALGAVLVLSTAVRLPRPELSSAAALAGGVLVVAAVGGQLRALLPDAWTVPGYLACSVALPVVVRAYGAGVAEPVRRGLTRAGVAVQGLCVLWALPVAVAALLGPVHLVADVWAGAPADARIAMTPDSSASVATWLVPHPAVATLVLAVAAVGLAGVARAPRSLGVPLSTAACSALGLAWGAVLSLPFAFALPYHVALVIPLLVTAAMLAVVSGVLVSGGGGDRVPLAAELSVVRTAALLALLASVSVACLALASTPATLVVLSVLTLLFAAVCMVPGRRAAWYGDPSAAGAAMAYATALVVAAGAALELPAHHTALLVLVVPTAAALLAAGLGRHVLTVPIECGGLAAGLVALALALGDGPTLALVLALGGVIAAGTAVREERRRTAGALATVLFVLATLVRLALWKVNWPEAYSLPVTVPALWVGAVRRRRDATASSWAAYGPGLGVTLLPSLVAAWADPDWVRPLLLGGAALLLTLAGARLRLQAPLVLGAAVLAVDAVHELAPFVVQVAGAMPRWLPPALIGLGLLAVGATYERRLKDVRRAREALGRMR